MKELLVSLLLLCATLGNAKPLHNFQFSEFGRQWTTDSGGAPGPGSFSPSHVTPSSMGITLTLTETSSGSIVGGEVRTLDRYGYGTYQWTETVSQVVSGQVSAGFLYYNNSTTEIDFEQEGNLPSTFWLSNWTSVSTHEASPVCCYAATATHVMRMLWNPGEIDYYIDGALVAVHTQYVPSVAAYFIFNFWGTNSVNWGGLITPGTRYFTITRFTYTAL